MSARRAAGPAPFDILTSPLRGTTLIEANAGCGKTHALANLFLRLVAEGELFANQILVVTYTEAATAELRERIRGRLRGALRFRLTGDRSGLDDPEVAHLLSGLRNPDAAEARLRDAVRSFDETDIVTIHGFCRSVLAENAFESGTAFRWEILADQSRLEQEVTDDFWRARIPGAPTSWLRLRRGVGRFRRGPEGLLGLLRLRSLSPSRRVLPEGEAPEVAGLEREITACFDAFRALWRREGATAAGALLGFAGWNNNRFRESRRRALVDAAGAFAARSDPWDEDLLDAVCGLAQEALDGLVKKGYEAPRHELFGRCGELAAGVASLRPLLDRCGHVLERDYLSYVERELSVRKRRSGLWSFDDLLVGTYGALEGAGGASLSGRLRERYRAALIDEFQDTDPLQNRIFLRAFGGGETALYLIGDPKQAIYGFRGADIYAYLEAARQVSSRLSLGTNWRSTPELVRGVNELFGGHSLPFAHPGISFAPSLAAPAAASGAGKGVPRGRSELVLHFHDTDECLNKGEALELFCEAACRTVLRLVREGRRPAGVAVLVRSNRQASLMQQALGTHGVPGVLYCAESVFGSREAAEIERILAGLVRPGSEALLRAAMATSILGLSAAELDALSAGELDQRLDRTRALAEAWRSHGVMRATRMLLDEEEVRERLLGLPEGERRLTNVLHLMELLHRAEGELHLEPEELLGWLRERMSSGGDGEDSELRLETDEDAVIISTIHHAKGLQYEVALCPFLWDGVRSDREDAVTFHDARGVPVLDLEGGEESRRRSTEEQVAELMRLAYVALTRARRACYVYWGWVSGADTSPLYYLLHCRDPEVAQARSEGDLAGAMRSRWKDLTGAELRRELEALESASGGAVQVRPLEEGAMDAPPQEATELEEDCRTFHRTSWNAWSVTSYSALTRGRHQDARDRDREAVPLPGVQAEGAGILSFPRGAAAGTFIHALFQDVDGQAAREPELSAWLAEQCRAWGYEGSWAPALAEMMMRALQAPLAGPWGDVRLADVPPGDQLRELEFHLPLGALDPATLARIFEGSPGEYGALAAPVGGLGFGEVRGFLQGFVDTIFRVGGRYYVVDWKSNYLGATEGDYGPEALQRAMRENLYLLQLSLYTVAVDRYLRSRFDSYAYEEHFGGVFYVFVRGVRPDSPGRGVYFTRPPEDLVRGAELALGGAS